MIVITNLFAVAKFLFADFALVIFLVSILFYAFFKAALPSPYLSLACGFISFVFIPGYYLSRILSRKIVNFAVIPYSLILGLAFQIVGIAIYSVLSQWVLTDFNNVLFVTALIFVVSFKAVASKMDISFSFIEIKSDVLDLLHNPVFYIFLFALVFRLFFGLYNEGSFLPDASLYLDNARVLVQDGVFSSNVLLDENFAALTTSGLISHSFVTYLFSVFFSIFRISLDSALGSIALIGALLIFPVYDLSRKFFGKTSGIIAAVIISVHPLFLYFSSMLFGPEISALLFTLVSLYFVVEGSESQSVLLLFISGFLLGVSEELWWAQFYMVILFVPLFFVFAKKQSLSIKRNLTKLLVGGLLVLTYVFALKLYSLYFIYLPIVIAEIFLFLLLFKTKRGSYLSLGLVVGLIVPTLVPIVRHYLIPSQVHSTVTETMNVGLAPSIFNAFTLFLTDTSVNSMINCTQYLSEYATSVIVMVFLFAFLSMRNLKEKLLLGSVFFTSFVLISFSSSYAFPQFYSSLGRFYLLPVAVMIIIGSSFIVQVIKDVPDKLFSLLIKIGGKTRKIRLCLFVAAILLSLIFGVFFVPKYQTSIQDIQQENPLEKYHWSNNLLNWIARSTSNEDVILTSRARELAWLTNRQTVSLFSHSTNPENMTFLELGQLFNHFNASYLLVDSYCYWHFPNLRFLYEPLNATAGALSMPEGALTAYLANSSDELPLFELVYYAQKNEATCCVWKIAPASNFYADYLYQDFSSADWSAGNGEFSSIDNATKLAIAAGKEYAYTYRTAPLNLTLAWDQYFFAWSLDEIDGINSIRIELWSGDNHVTDISPLLVTGPQTISLAINSINDIDDMRIVILGEAGQSITINWLTLGAYSLIGS